MSIFQTFKPKGGPQGDLNTGANEQSVQRASPGFALLSQSLQKL